jgi:hypothetical protein
MAEMKLDAGTRESDMIRPLNCAPRRDEMNGFYRAAYSKAKSPFDKDQHSRPLVRYLAFVLIESGIEPPPGVGDDIDSQITIRRPIQPAAEPLTSISLQGPLSGR